MIGSLLVLLGFQLAGEVLRRLLGLPLPGPVIGMLLLAGCLAFRNRREGEVAPQPPSALDRTADTMLRHLGLLFIPAGVGIVAQTDILKREWLPIVAGVTGSTLLGLAACGVAMHVAGRRSPERRKIRSQRRPCKEECP